MARKCATNCTSLIRPSVKNMSLFTKLFFFTGWLAIGTCFGALEFDFRHQASRSIADNFQQTLVWEHSRGWGRYSVGLRLTEESARVDRAGYFGEIEYAPFSFLEFSARLHQHVRIEDASGATSAMATVALCTPGESVRFCATFGALRRWWQIDKRAWFPLLYRSSIEEWDAVAHFNLHWQWSDYWVSDLSLGSLDNAEIFNLHNPSTQLRVTRKQCFPGVDMFAFVRYQVVLGFAIFDNWTTGVGLRIL
jgi:hypothetical protein